MIDVGLCVRGGFWGEVLYRLVGSVSGGGKGGVGGGGVGVISDLGVGYFFVWSW